MKSDGELLRDYAETRSEDAFAELVRRHLDLVYFERRQHAEIGAKLGVSENTARMRVERALEKLHAHLARRGVTTTAAALSAAISANAVQAAPVSLSAAITTTAAALAGTTLTTAATATATKAIAMTAIQKTLITVSIVAAVSTGLYEARQAFRWRTQVQTLERQQASLAEQITRLNIANENLSNRVAPANLLDHSAIRGAAVTRNELSGTPQIDIEFSEVGKELFATVTRENINKRLAIVLDGHLYSAPVIRSEIPEGKAQITGNFTEDKARALAAKINDAISGK